MKKLLLNKVQSKTSRYFVAWSNNLCGVRFLRLRSILGRASSALIFLCTFMSPLISNLEAFAVSRIQSTRVDRGSVMKIQLSPGLGSLLKFPCELEEVFVGRNEGVNAQISPNSKKNLFLNLKSNALSPTNMIVKCQEDRNVFVFDVVPSKSTHQDYMEVRGAFGRPADSEGAFKSLVSQKTSKVVVRKPVLIKQGSR